jgi:hypothetical protein
MLLHNLHFVFLIVICGSNAQIIIDNGHQTWQTSWARRVRDSWKKVVRSNIIVKMVLGNIFVVLRYWLLFTCVSADVCTKPEVSASAYTTQDATVLTSIAFVAELTLNCGNLVTGLPLYAEINGKTLPAARIGDGNKYQVKSNSGTPRSSCICLLLTYQGAPVAMRRHLDSTTCNFRTWVRATDLHAGHA